MSGLWKETSESLTDIQSGCLLDSGLTASLNNFTIKSLPQLN